MTGHEHPLSRLGELDELLRLIRGQRHRLLDEDVLAGGDRALRELDMSGHGCRDDDRFDLVVLQDILEAVGQPRRREAGLHAFESLGVLVADPRELGEVGEVTGEVRAPASEPDLCDHGRHSFQTLPPTFPSTPVALRRSTTRRARFGRSS